MPSIQEIESVILQLSKEDQNSLKNWLVNELEPIQWDQQIERDVQSGIVGLAKQAVEEELWPTPAESFRAGWRDVKAGRVHPIQNLWEGIHAE
ncbi:MAG: hypothetical protein H7839_17855 [Magnetococcus sp. YQC-5]